MEEDRQKAISAYHSLKEELGKKPSSREFFKVYNKRDLYRAFEGGNAYSRLQELAGDKPNVFSSSKSDLNEILVKWGELARKTLSQYGKLPIQDDWSINDLRPSVSGIEKSHNIKWTEIPYIFQNEFSENKEWKEVLESIPSFEEQEEFGETKNEECFVYLMKDLRNNSHKIGISSSPGIRERTLQSEQPKTELIAAKKYINRKIALNIEKALHETYKHKRKRGEWFDLDTEDLKEIVATLND
ncbi:MAG: GIY-YIG nuclease family protein [Candidatus Thiodiazotropha sp.]